MNGKTNSKTLSSGLKKSKDVNDDTKGESKQVNKEKTTRLVSNKSQDSPTVKQNGKNHHSEPTKTEDLRKLIEQKSSVIDRYVNLIPAEFYLPLEEDEVEGGRKIPRQKRKLTNSEKEELNQAKQIAKRARLNPSKPNTVTELQHNMEDPIEEDTEEPIEESPLVTLISSAKDKGSIDDLRKRVDEKIAEFRKQRKSIDVAEKKERREASKEKETRRKDQRKKKLNKDKEAKKAKSFSELAEEQSKIHRGKIKQEEIPEEEDDDDEREDDMDEDDFSDDDDEDDDGSIITSPKKSKGSDFDYGRFDFGDDGKAKPSYLTDKSKTKKVRLNVLLQRAEKKQKRMQELSKTEEGKEELKKIAFKRAMEKAQGDKVLDDPTMLKKALKRKQKSKFNSHLKAKERSDAQKKQGQEKQKQRVENIKQHIQKAKERKLGIKKSVKRAGFEGRKKDFVNQNS